MAVELVDIAQMVLYRSRVVCFKDSTFMPIQISSGGTLMQCLQMVVRDGEDVLYTVPQSKRAASCSSVPLINPIQRGFPHSASHDVRDVNTFRFGSLLISWTSMMPNAEGPAVLG